MSRLADKYGGDQAAMDVSRVMRLPGFRNKKADRRDAMVSWADHGGGPVKAEAFRDLPETRKTPTGGERENVAHGAQTARVGGIGLMSARRYGTARSRTH